MTRPGRNRLRTGHRQARWPSQTPALLSQSSFNWGSSWPPTSGRNCGKRKVSRRFLSEYVCCEKIDAYKRFMLSRRLVPQYRSTAQPTPSVFLGLRYADGILPGQGSPEPYDVPSPPPSAPSPKPGKVAAPKKRKRIKIKVIQFKTKADIEADRKRVPPPPPPGDPPLMKHQEFIDTYAYKGTLPKHLMALVATA